MGDNCEGWMEKSGQSHLCQFADETDAFSYADKQYCRFHLPMGEKGHGGKADWDYAWRTEIADVVIERIKEEIEKPEGDREELDFGGIVMPSSIQLSGYTIPPVTFKYAQFGGNADFKDARFAGIADFTLAEFSGIAKFKDALFSGDAYFREAFFSSNADFTEAQFSRIATFFKARFSGDLGFSKAQFFSTAVFTDTAFYGGAGFTDARFSEDVGFSKAKFYRIAAFSQAEFSGNAAFGEAHFSDHTAFEKALFSGTADFSKAYFSSTTEFLEARLLSNADFQKSQFRDGANFTKAQFTGVAAFGGAQFTGDAYFRKSVFSHNANFRETRFLDDAYFREALFYSSVDFSDAEFSGHAYFIETQFVGYANFQGDNGIENGKARSFRAFTCKDALFLGEADFSNREFLKSTNFDVRSFEKAPRFHNSILHQDTTFPRIDCFKERDTIASTRAYQTLRLAMESQRDRQTEGRFFALEQESRRRSGELIGLTKWISFAYEKGSNYGLSVVRPLWMLFLIFFVSATAMMHVAYYSGVRVSVGGPAVDKPAIVGDAFVFSFRQSVMPFDALRQRSEELKKWRLFPEPLGLFQVLAAIQSVLSALCILMFILAVRWRYRR